jgi:GH15 family glucan-1,4-alpha-glucosidase
MRTDGYAPIAGYAAIGDGRTVALVARDSAIDWLCLPDLDDPSVFAALLDAGRGGAFRLAPAEPFESERRYVPDTNVLETAFRTAGGAVAVTDALTLPARGSRPSASWCGASSAGREPCGCAGRSMRARDTRHGPCAIAPTAPGTCWPRAVRRVPCAAGAAVSRAPGTPRSKGRWSFTRARPPCSCSPGRRTRRSCSPGRDDVERRLRDTIAFWRGWAGRCEYDGPWRDMVVRSALALKLLVHAPTGAIAAAATTGLPEELGGVRNWDYRASWIRDCAFTLDALLALGHRDEADAFFGWLMHASQRTHPRLQPLYRLDGGTQLEERELTLAGYRGSRPVYAGNGAAGQLQLGIYGTMLETVRLRVAAGHAIDDATGADGRNRGCVCALWRKPDEGIWELRGEPRHFTHSMCWVALDRALTLAQDAVPGAHARRWRHERERIEAFLERECYDERRGTYTRAAGGDDLDAAVLVAGLTGYPHRERVARSVDAIRAELGAGPLIHRYRGEDGLPGEEGAFLPCSFWLAGALARLGRAEEAAEMLEALFAFANDVGLYAEEVDPGDGTLLGNSRRGSRTWR